MYIFQVLALSLISFFFLHTLYSHRYLRARLSCQTACLPPRPTTTHARPARLQRPPQGASPPTTRKTQMLGTAWASYWPDSSPGKVSGTESVTGAKVFPFRSSHLITHRTFLSSLFRSWSCYIHLPNIHPSICKCAVTHAEPSSHHLAFPASL